jgi:hypothetical protein
LRSMVRVLRALRVSRSRQRSSRACAGSSTS